MDLELFQKARERLSFYLRPTPLILSESLSTKVGLPVWLKLETQQPTGAFKVRPAFNGILASLDEARSKGVITTSSGNFAQAVAYAGQILGVKTTIVMTEDTQPLKIRRTKDLGGNVVLCGPTFEDRFATVEKIQKETGALVLHGFDSEETIAGNGTLAFELLELFENQTFTVLCPASGGGLISGIATVLTEVNPQNEIYGFQPENGGAIFRSLQKGERVNVGKVRTIADALVASTPGQKTFEIIQKKVKAFHLVSEAEIVDAMRTLFDDQKLVIEPGGAVAVAGLLQSEITFKTKNVVCILSGGNIDADRLAHLIER